ncbi:TrbG/VirB9 family P-type conjugative transfer protein [Parerythrobacter lacustris]|uniref:TrbG/VirB9 family P-type conjugative transfer protein n=1 Tax=Parerythrobacter lacustris TaxID=2969984 RepID=A0ABT1XT05_9SPHN|nr:TrbG/VirB9 family P-type conjugative transfer protein [Parerythrobacter lacustris]MCR2834756.1 TrbG/VirB9 family P-type conjugative transfer protein [Parerythrobacter lacustris]
MIRLPALLAFAFASPVAAQLVPQPEADNPRVQRVAWQAGETVMLTALPQSGLTVMLEPGEQIARVTVGAARVFDIRVSSERDSFLVVPLVEGAESVLSVNTDRRNYTFDLRTGTGLMAALLVRLDYAAPDPTGGQRESVTSPGFAVETAPAQTWTYRLRGDRTVQPQALSDDGLRTRIVFAPEQDLPAIFAIGPTGEEQVVDGYMRDGIFVIDRVWEELVFRIDKEKATARRNAQPEAGDG